MSSLYFMTIICDRNQTRRFLAFYKEHGVSVTFQALGRGVMALLVSLVRQLFVLVPAAWLLSLSGNLDAVWYSFCIAEVFALMMATLFFRRTYKNKIQRLETIEFK